MRSKHLKKYKFVTPMAQKQHNITAELIQQESSLQMGLAIIYKTLKQN